MKSHLRNPVSVYDTNINLYRDPRCQQYHMCSSNNVAGGQRTERTQSTKACFWFFSCLDCCQLDKQDASCFSGGRGISPPSFFWAHAYVCVYVCVSAGFCSCCRGPNGHSVTPDGQEKPRGHSRSHRQCSFHAVRVCMHVLVRLFGMPCSGALVGCLQ